MEPTRAGKAASGSGPKRNGSFHKPKKEKGQRQTMGDIPPAITTAHLLLRGLVPSLLGCPVGEETGDGGGVRASAFQMTYRKDLPKLGVEGASRPGSSDVKS